MTGHGSAARRAERGARRAMRGASPWIERLGRLGYAAKGTIYILIGALAVQAARRAGGAVTDAQGALTRIVEAPLGRVLLAVIALGLAGYTLWCFVRAALAVALADLESRGTQSDVARRLSES